MPILHSSCYHNPNQVIRVAHRDYTHSCLTHGLAAPIQSPTHPPSHWITQKTFNGFLLFSKNAKLPIIFLILSPTPCKIWQTPSCRAELSKYLKERAKILQSGGGLLPNPPPGLPSDVVLVPRSLRCPLGASPHPQLPGIRGLLTFPLQGAFSHLSAPQGLLPPPISCGVCFNHTSDP